MCGASILCKDTVIDAGDPTMSFLANPVKTNEIDSRQTVLRSGHVSSLYLYACNLQVVNLNALYLQYGLHLLKYQFCIA